MIPVHQSTAWAASGAMALTGRADGPPLEAPDGVVDRMALLGRPLGVDVLPLLGERAAIAGLTRRGDVSCGGATRLLPAADGWVAVSLARPDDVEVVAAWLELAREVDDDPWPEVADAVAGRGAAEVADRGTLLGLAVSAVPAPSEDADADGGDPVRAVRVSSQGGCSRPQPLVVDLSSLWAGPLCTRLLRDRGARVVKVESIDRPDGARRGPTTFFTLLHEGKEAVALDFRDQRDVERLRRLLLAADVVVEASRPRALEQLGVDAAEIVGRGPVVWLSITGHGRDGPPRDRVAFGDDGAAAGGLVAWDGLGPCFVADAVADPLAGVAAAAAALAALDAGGRWMIDVALRAVAGHVAAGAAGAAAARWQAGDPSDAAPPVAPVATGRAPEVGEHTAAVLDELGCR